LGHTLQPCTSFHKKAKVQMHEVRFLAAQVHLQSALKINRDPVLFNLLGVCLSELKDYPNSNKAFSEAIKMNPNYY